jgi:hypothetical protein
VKVTGDWIGTSALLPHGSKLSEARETFGLFGETTGTAADLYSMYGFNEGGFDQSLKLARKNCVS